MGDGDSALKPKKRHYSQTNNEFVPISINEKKRIENFLTASKNVIKLLKDDKERLRKLLKKSKNHEDNLQKQCNAYAKKLQQLENHLEIVTKEKHRIDGVLIHVQHELQQEKLKSVEQMNQLDEAKKQLHNYEIKMAQLETNASEMDAANKQSINCNIKLSQLDTMVNELAATKNQLADYKIQLESQAMELDATKKQLADCKTQLESQAMEFDATKKQLADYTIQLESMGTELDTAKKQLHEYEMRIAAFDELKLSYEHGQKTAIMDSQLHCSTDDRENLLAGNNSTKEVATFQNISSTSLTGNLTGDKQTITTDCDSMKIELNAFRLENERVRSRINMAEDSFCHNTNIKDDVFKNKIELLTNQNERVKEKLKKARKYLRLQARTIEIFTRLNTDEEIVRLRKEMESVKAEMHQTTMHFHNFKEIIKIFGYNIRLDDVRKCYRISNIYEKNSEHYLLLYASKSGGLDIMRTPYADMVEPQIAQEKFLPKFFSKLTLNLINSDEEAAEDIA